MKSQPSVHFFVSLCAMENVREHHFDLVFSRVRRVAPCTKNARASFHQIDRFLENLLLQKHYTQCIIVSKWVYRERHCENRCRGPHRLPLLIGVRVPWPRWVWLGPEPASTGWCRPGPLGRAPPLLRMRGSRPSQKGLSPWEKSKTFNCWYATEQYSSTNNFFFQIYCE